MSDRSADPPPVAEFALRGGARLVLDAWGLRLRRPPPAVDLGGPWEDLYVARVEEAGGAPGVALTFVEGLASLAGERSPAVATLFRLPESADLAPEALVAEIERFHRASRERG